MHQDTGMSLIIATQGYCKTQTQKETNLKAFVLHVQAAENVIDVFSGHGLQELTHLLLSLKGSHSSRYHRIICDID